MVKPKLLLHSCCGPCSTAVIERLKENYNITIFFYNPNIMGFAEYEKRKEAQVAFLDGYNASLEWEEKIAFQEGPYAVTQFAELVKGLENEAEGGKRCDLCFRHRLEETAKLAHLNAYDCFSTTLSVSPHKDFQKISRFGNQLSLAYQVAFLDENFKKKDGYQRSIQLSKEYKLYRQTYCGCKFINGGYER